MALNPKVAEIYRLRDDYGTGPGALSAGTTVVVTAICEPGTPGIGASATDTVCAEFTEDGAVRTLAIELPQFKELFRKVS